MRFFFYPKNYIQKISIFLLSLIAFGFPIENKYDKPLHRFSLSLIPDGIILPAGFEKKIYFYLTDIAALTLFLFLIFAFKIPLRRLFSEKGTLCLWIVFFGAFVSICFSSLWNYPVIYSRLFQLLTPIFLYSFLIQISFSEKTISFLVLLLIGAACMQSIFAVIQYFTQEPLGLRIFNESRDVPACFEIANGYRWIFDSIAGYTGPSPFVKRASGTMNHSNLAGGLISLSILLLYSFFQDAKKQGMRWVLSALLFFLMFSLCTTYSRSAIFGVAIGTFIWFGFTAFKQSLKEHKFLMKTVFFSGLLCCLLFFQQFQHRGGLLNYNNTVKSSDGIRIHAQSTAMKMIQDHPLLGVGYGQFGNESKHYVSKGEATPLAHNMYLLMAAETGIFSLIAFLSFLAILLWNVFQSEFTPKIASFVSILGLFLFIGCCDFYPLVIQEGKLMLFITAGLMMAEVKLLKQKSREILPCSL